MAEQLSEDQLNAEDKKLPAIDEHRPTFPGTASMYASQHRMAVTQEWMRGWNACLDAIDRLGGFRRG